MLAFMLSFVFVMTRCSSLCPPRSWRWPAPGVPPRAPGSGLFLVLTLNHVKYLYWILYWYL